MNIKTKIIVGVVYTAVVASGAYFLAPQKIKTVEKEVKVEVDKKDQKKDSKKHFDTTTTVNKRPDGSSTTVIHKIVDTGTTSEIKDVTAKSDSIEKSKEITKSSGTTSVSVLTGVDVTKPGGIVYGASLNRSILGPITIGIWGLSNGICGGSVGLSF